MGAKTWKLVACLGLALWCASCSRGGPHPVDRIVESGPWVEDESTWPSFRGDRATDGVAASQTPGDLKLIWTRHLKTTVRSTAAIVDGTVFVGCQKPGMVALDLATGKEKWRYSTEEPVESSPCVNKATVYFGDNSGAFYALDALKGTWLWTGHTGARIISSANVTDSGIVVGSYDNKVYCFAPADGKVLWNVETDDYVHGSPSVSGTDVAVAGCDGFLRIIDAASGRETSTIDLDAKGCACAPAWRDGRVFITSQEGKVKCVDPAARRIVWEWTAPEQVHFTGSAAVTKDMVIVGGSDGKVRALSTATGEKLWQFDTRGEVESSPVVWGDNVYFGSDDGNVYGLALADGKRVWRFAAGGMVIASPTVGAGRMVISNDEGAVYCFGTKAK